MIGKNEKCYWITGASSGIGKALAEYYARPGIILGLAARRPEKLEDVAARCRKLGAQVYSYVVDVGIAEAMWAAAGDFLEATGRVDIVIANAGIRAEEDSDYLDWEMPLLVMKTNFVGVINTFGPFIPSMRERKSGHLAVVSSIASFRGTQNSGLYSASKAAANIWTESLRLRLKPYQIPVSTLCAGFVDTDMTRGLTFSMPGILSPEEAAKEIDYGIRHRKRVYTFPWQSRMIWTAFRILPGPLYDWIIIWAKRMQSPRRTNHDSLGRL